MRLELSGRCRRARRCRRASGLADPEQITLPDGQLVDALIDGGSLVRFVRWQMARSRAISGPADVPFDLRRASAEVRPDVQP